MTEQKRKRGRPPGSGNKKLIIQGGLPEAEIVAVAQAAGPNNPDYNPTIKVSEDSELPEMFLLKGRQKNYIAVRKDLIPERPYPSNWNELGKVAKLAWLTEHRK